MNENGDTQTKADFERVRLDFGVPELSYNDALQMIARVEERYARVGPRESFEDTLEFVLDIFTVYDEERAAYKSFLGTVFGRRVQKKRRERDEAFAIPFAPPDATPA